MRLIDADALIEGLKKDWPQTSKITWAQIVAKCAPTIETEPAKHGEWIVYEMHTTQYGEVGFECSACGVPYRLKHRLGEAIGWHYCPTCGAKMKRTGNDAE